MVAALASCMCRYSNSMQMCNSNRGFANLQPGPTWWLSTYLHWWIFGCCTVSLRGTDCKLLSGVKNRSDLLLRSKSEDSSYRHFVSLPQMENTPVIMANRRKSPGFYHADRHALDGITIFNLFTTAEPDIYKSVQAPIMSSSKPFVIKGLCWTL